MVKPKSENWSLQKLIKKAADVDLNTAIALSKSLADNNKINKRRKKEASEIPVHLMLEPCKMKAILDVRLSDSILQPLKFIEPKTNNHKEAINWNKASLKSGISPWDLSYDNINISEQMEYYVQSLMPPISPSKVRVGDKIFAMSEIAGRDNSVICTPKENLFESLRTEEPAFLNQNQKDDGLHSKLTIIENPSQIKDLSFSKCIKQTECISEAFEDENNESHDDYECERFLKMFNDHRHSDLLVLLKSGEILNLHKFVLTAWQCRGDAINEDQYFVTDTEDDIVIKIFKHLYSNGKFRIDDIIDREGCISFCKKFGIDHTLLRRSKVSPKLTDEHNLHCVQSINVSETLSPIKGPLNKEKDNNAVGIYLSTPIFSNHNQKSPPKNNLSDVDLFDTFSEFLSLESSHTSQHIPDQHLDTFPERKSSKESLEGFVPKVVDPIKEEIIISDDEENEPNDHSPFCETSSLPLHYENIPKIAIDKGVEESKAIKNDFHPHSPITYLHGNNNSPNIKQVHYIQDEKDDIILNMGIHSPVLNSKTHNFPKTSPKKNLILSESMDSVASPLPLFQRMKINTQILNPVKENVVIAKPIEQEKTVEPLDTKSNVKKSLPEKTSKKTTVKRRSAASDQKLSPKVPKKVAKTVKYADVYETPPRQKIEFNPFTPMPDFANMATPEMQNKLVKCGLKQKSLSKKQCVILLQEAHRVTHQIDRGSDTDSTTSEDCSQDSYPPDTQEADNNDAASDAIFNEAIYTILKADYFLDILTYKSIDVTKIISDLKSQNVKFHTKKIYDFLDNQCISYTKTNPDKNKIRRPKATRKMVI